MIWFRVYDKIKGYSVISATDKFVTFINDGGKKERERKRSNFVNWFPVQEDAINFLVNKHKVEVEQYEYKLSRAIERLESVKEYVKTIK